VLSATLLIYLFGFKQFFGISRGELNNTSAQVSTYFVELLVVVAFNNSLLAIEVAALFDTKTDLTAFYLFCLIVCVVCIRE